MHGWHRGVERRIEELERRLGSYPTPPTPEETARRLELCRASLAGVPPENEALALTEGEAAKYRYMLTLAAPVYQSLFEDGILDPETGKPLGAEAVDESDQGDDLDPYGP